VAIVTDLDLPVFDYMAPDLTGDVYHQRLAEVRRHGWLAQSPLSYVVLDREAGEFFLRSKSTAFPGREIADIFGVTTGPLRAQIDANILNQTSTHHRRLRALVGPSFSPRATDRCRPVMRRFLGQLWADIARANSCEFVDAVAKPYPSLTIAAILGAPAADAPRLHEWSNWVQRQFDIRALAEELAKIEQATAEVYEYVEALLGLRRAAPSDDLISSLLAAEAEGDQLSHSECVNLVLNVIAGGIDTTQSQLAHALRLFAGHPDQWAFLGQHPALVPQAVTEVLRYEPITPFTARICLEPVEHRGVVFPAGTIVSICAERANREITAESTDRADVASTPGTDKTTGPAGGADDGEAGERFDITAQRDERLLTFGAGPHYCLGANLARAELEEALAFLAPRMPGLALGGEPDLGGVEGIYGINALPLRWSGR
jgi:cytochrome P450